jgi:hypothetical protein
MKPKNFDAYSRFQQRKDTFEVKGILNGMAAIITGGTSMILLMLAGKQFPNDMSVACFFGAFALAGYCAMHVVMAQRYRKQSTAMIEQVRRRFP